MVAQDLIDSVFIETSNFADPNKQSLSQWLQQMEAARRGDYKLFRDYYGGEHPTKLTDRLKKFLGGELKFRDNFMEVVVDALAERLTITSFATNETEDEKPVSTWAWDTWQANRMEETQGIVHTDAVMIGDAYVLVDWDNETGKVRFTQQLAETIIPHYDELTGRVDFVSKKWVQEEGEIGSNTMTRLNLYYANRVEKYVAKGNIWEKFIDENDPVPAFPQPWVDSQNRPLGVAIKHFRNKPQGGSFGQSELNNAIHLQDLVNKTLIDLAMQNDNAGFGRAYTIGIQIDQSNIDMLPGSLWNLKADDETGGEVGFLPADSPEGPLKTLEMLIQHISGITRTPQHLFQIMGGAPSGESLKVAESGLVKKVLNRQTGFGNSWEDVMALGLRLQNHFGETVGKIDERFEVGWANPETRNDKDHLAGLKTKADLGIPQEQIWVEMGYDQEKIDEMKQQQEDEAKRNRNIGSVLLRDFDAGLEDGEIGAEGLGPETPE